MYKTLGGYNWTDLFINATTNATNTNPMREPMIIDSMADAGLSDESTESLDKTIFDSAKELQSSFHGLKAVSCDNKLFSYNSNREIVVPNCDI